ncbi:hypothetical protein NDU88_005928 [Pleurodeles waltl]|uniref:Uncharacterized protein n=1 Tax=Pleurodeles waltl TaxID=8319 RepID=A0AAV7X0Z4_PLEWA|nr:hypothetical protein NDU88_005928 [Pleurodeles waltl]
MAEYMKKATKNLQASQELEKQWHDQKAVLAEYYPGEKVRVLEPVAPGALQDKWSGPHLIVEKKGEVTYLVDLGTARSPRLKPYYDRADLTLLMATDKGQEEESDPLADLFSNTEAGGLVEGVVLADCLTAEQKEDCKNLLGQVSELFSLTPGTMALILTLAVFDRQGGGPREHRRQAGGASMGIPTAAFGPAPLAGSRQCTAAPLNPPRRRSLLHRRGDSDPPYRHPDPGGRTAEIRMATVKYATGATAPVAQLPLRRLDSEPASSWKRLSRWAGWRSERDRPPAQRESQNYRRGLSTAER